MKILSSLIAVALSGSLYAQTTAYTDPAGYTSQVLAANQFNLVGLTLHGAPLVSGNFETVSGTTLTDVGLSFTPIAGRIYVLEITDGPLVGTIQELLSTAISGTSITTSDNLQTAGLLVGNKYTLKLAPTIEEVFGTTSSILSKGPNSASPASDVIWVPQGSGVYTRYYIRSSDSTVRDATSNVATLNVPLIYTDGIIVQKKNTGNSDLVVSGQLKTTVSKLVVSEGYNLVGTAYPAGATLQNSGLDSILSKGPNSASPLSDIVWIPDGIGGYVRYYLRSSDTTWRNAQTNILAPADLSLSSAILIQRKATGSINATLTPPSNYAALSNL